MPRTRGNGGKRLTYTKSLAFRQNLTSEAQSPRLEIFLPGEIGVSFHAFSVRTLVSHCSVKRQKATPLSRFAI